MENYKVYTVEEICEILKVGKNAIYRQIKNGNLKAVKVGHDWRISENNLKAYIDGNTQE